MNDLGGGFKYIFVALPGEMIQFDLHILHISWKNQLYRWKKSPAE